METADSLRRSTTGIRNRRTLLVVAIAAATVAAVVVAITLDKGTGGGDYITGKVDRGNVDVTVSATGTLQAVKTVEVGSQASGTVRRRMK